MNNLIGMVFIGVILLGGGVTIFLLNRKVDREHINK